MNIIRSFWSRFRSQRIFWVNGPKGRTGYEFVDFWLKLTECGIPWKDHATGKCLRVKIVNGSWVIDGTPGTIESYCTHVYTIANPASPGTGTLTLSGNLTDGDTVVIGSTTYTAQDTFVDAANNFHIGATASDTIDNLISTINASAEGSAVEGTDFPTGGTASTDVVASAGAGDTMDVTSDPFFFGAVADAIATTETSATAAWGSTTLDIVATVDITYGATTVGTYEITAPGVTDTVTGTIRQDLVNALNTENVSFTSATVAVDGTDYVFTITTLSTDSAALQAKDLDRNAVAVTPTVNCT